MLSRVVQTGLYCEFRQETSSPDSKSSWRFVVVSPSARIVLGTSLLGASTGRRRNRRHADRDVSILENRSDIGVFTNPKPT